jgi:hypothetical protein
LRAVEGRLAKTGYHEIAEAMFAIANLRDPLPKNHDVRVLDESTTIISRAVDDRAGYHDLFEGGDALKHFGSIRSRAHSKNSHLQSPKMPRWQQRRVGIT